MIGPAANAPFSLGPLRLRRGPTLMALATITFTVMVGCLKVARQEMPAVELMAWRGAIGVPLAFAIARGTALGIANQRVLLLRIALGSGAMFSFFTAAKGLSLGDMALISRLQPILLAIGAPLVLGAAEKPGARVWVVMAAGLVGCAVLLAPDLAVGSVWGLWALLAATFSAGAHLCLRILGRTERPEAVVLWFQVGVTVVAAAALGAGLGTAGAAARVPPGHLWPWILGAGAAATIGQVLMTRAYRIERAAVVAAATYLTPLWGFAGDLVFFVTTPSWADLLGGGLIVAGGLWLVVGQGEPTSPEPAKASNPDPS